MLQLETDEEIIYFWVDANWLRSFEGQAVHKFQDLRRSQPAAVSERGIRFSDVLKGQLGEEGYVTVSHRWISESTSDPHGEQLQLSKKWLKDHPWVKLIWFDV